VFAPTNTVGVVQVESSLTHSSKAPGSNPCTYRVKTRLQTLLTHTCNVRRYTEAFIHYIATNPGWGAAR
jgi:hypothetical protein